MRLRRPVLLTATAVVAAAGFAAGAAQSQLPTTAAFVATDDLWTAEGGGRTVTVALGAKVEFSYPEGDSAHNARFNRPGVECRQTVPVVRTTGLTVPPGEDLAGWEGECTFSQPGVYSFLCDPHVEMTGTVRVADETGTVPTTSTPTTTTGGPSPTPTPTTPGTGTGGGAGSGSGGGGTGSGSGGTGGGTGTGTGTGDAGSTPTPTGTGAAPAATPARIVVARSQRGSSLRGRVTGARAGSEVTVELLVRRGDVGAGGTRTATVRAGRLVRKASSTGTLSFVVKLDARARRALARRKQLAVNVRTVAAAPNGKRRTTTTKVSVRPTA